MTKIAFTFAILLSTSVYLSSCQKCTVCTATDEAGTEFVEEYCGSGGDVDQFEKDWIDSFTIEGVTNVKYCQRKPSDPTN